MKLIQVNEDFWCCPSEIRSVDVLRRTNVDDKPVSFAYVYLKACGNENVGVGFGKHLGDMWGKTGEEQAAKFAQEINRHYFAEGLKGSG